MVEGVDTHGYRREETADRRIDGLTDEIESKDGSIH